MDYRTEQKKIEDSIERAKNTIGWHENRIEDSKKELASLEEERIRLAAINEFESILYHFFEYFKVTNQNPAAEFLRCIGNVLSVKTKEEMQKVVKLIEKGKKF